MRFSREDFKNDAEVLMKELYSEELYVIMKDDDGPVGIVGGGDFDRVNDLINSKHNDGFWLVGPYDLSDPNPSKLELYNVVRVNLTTEEVTLTDEVRLEMSDYVEHAQFFGQLHNTYVEDDIEYLYTGQLDTDELLSHVRQVKDYHPHVCFEVIVERDGEVVHVDKVWSDVTIEERQFLSNFSCRVMGVETEEEAIIKVMQVLPYKLSKRGSTVGNHLDSLPPVNESDPDIELYRVISELNEQEEKDNNGNG